MKKILSIFTAIAVSLSLVAMPVFADTTTPAGITSKNVKAIQKNIDMVQKQIKKLQSDKEKINAAMNEAIKKANEQDKKKDDKKKSTIETKTLSINEQIAKLRAAVQAAVDKDKKEVSDLEKAIDKAKKQYADQLTSLTKQKATITAALAKKLAEAKDEATRTSLNSYATRKLAAIDSYISTLNNLLPKRQALWDSRLTVMKERQLADITYLTTMTDIKIAELNDKLITPPTPTPAPSVDSAKVAQIKEKYQKQLDAITKKIEELKKKLAALQAQLPPAIKK